MERRSSKNHSNPNTPLVLSIHPLLPPPMPPAQPNPLLDPLDTTPHPRPFKSPTWKPGHRRPKPLKQLLTLTTTTTTTANTNTNTTAQATYANIESAPSLHPANARKWCDVTGLPARYTDPKTRLRYVDREVYAVIGALPPGGAERYLELRGANVVLK